MSQKNESTLLIVSLLFTVGILGAGYWFFTRQNPNAVTNLLPSPQASVETPLPSPASPGQASEFPLPTAVSPGTTVKIDGSTSMVGINQALKQAFESKFANTIVSTNARGSSKGIDLLLNGRVDVAAISRPLTAPEQSKGLVAIPITKDAIAVIVGEKNPFRNSLTRKQISNIFTGVTKNWSAVGGTNAPIQVYNRPLESGTRSAFQETVLEGSNFGTTPNIKTMPQDGTTLLIQQLGTNGVSYATSVQASRQKTARIVPIDNLKPEDKNYPFLRFLYYVYKTPASEPVKAFLGYATSPEGQATIANPDK